jgi:hypothetical protein
MKKSTKSIEHRCPSNYPCFYRRSTRCTFWEQAEAIPAVWEKVFPDDPDWDLRVIDTFREPCLWLAEERRKSCAGFIIPGGKGWLECEECKESLCKYMGEPFRVGDVLWWMRDDSA